MLYAKYMIEADLIKMLAEVDMTPATKANYEHYCRDFWQFYFGQNHQADAKDAEPVHVAQWLQTHPHWSSATRYQAVASLKKFYKWKFGEGHPILQMRVKKTDPGPQRTPESDELLQVLSMIDTTTAGGIRDLAILSLMADTGLRASEVVNLELDRLDLRRQRLTVLVKGGGIAEKLFFDYTSVCLQNWLVVREHVAKKNVKTVFVAIGGKKPGERMTRSGLRYIVETLAEKTGTRHFSPHALRRTFATLATENGAPSRVIQVAGGWKSIRMVERYTRALKQEAIKPFSPMDRLMGS